ncbi:MAG TPA: XrtA system polysaccharide deacetylase [Terriglobales bacterium]|jgi:polysaccharide deacetylase family protein (PEP-CTERM system associated)|nr:XrtA system polysaccharide deacetylase [Terriglobales bacterium]
MKSIMSVDVEDWFHILEAESAPDISQWNSLPSCVERNFLKLLDLFSEKNVHVTCFFLGYVAERYPHLVKEALNRGHEIASHGYGHRLIYTMAPQAFLEDARKSKEILEGITGQAVTGYRAPGFSVTADTPWFFEKLVEAGFRYDSSVFPAPRQHGGLNTKKYSPHLVADKLMEFPITVAEVLGKRFCFFGGGYLRLFPYSVVRQMSRKVLGENRPVVFYIHPREIDPGHPRLRLGLTRTFKSYVNLKTTEPKLRHILDEFQVTTFAEFIAENPSFFINQPNTRRKPTTVTADNRVAETA